ncbi:MAG: NVEALA domain-containing protein [Tannerella sp.]|jgi:hypothetical protein|nr:NVEALA domain-containing protein [Tannerella sp.]
MDQSFSSNLRMFKFSNPQMPKVVMPQAPEENVLSPNSRNPPCNKWVNLFTLKVEKQKNKKINNHVNDNIMTKKVLYGLAVIVIAALAVVNLNINNSQTGKLSDMSLANVEALAQMEGGTFFVACASAYTFCYAFSPYTYSSSLSGIYMGSYLAY